MEDFKKQLETSGNIPIFELPVIDIRNMEPDYIVFNIEVKKGCIYAFHEATTLKEEQSRKVAFCKVDIDTDFSFDAHLVSLYDECIQKINDSEFFILK
jgi:hypothetical protein